MSNCAHPDADVLRVGSDDSFWVEDSKGTQVATIGFEVCTACGAHRMLTLADDRAAWVAPTGAF